MKRSRDSQTVPRRALGALEAAKQFRRVNGFMPLPTQRAALDAHYAKLDATRSRYDQDKKGFA